MKVLIVDDEPDIIRFLDYALSREHVVTSTSDALLAEKSLQDCDFDVLLTDYNMPLLSGQHLCKLAHERNPKCTTIVITGDEDFEDTHPQHVDRVLKKPVSIMHVIQLVAGLEKSKDQKGEQ